jgi:cytochrome c-type biogenesis protein CcmF
MVIGNLCLALALPVTIYTIFVSIFGRNNSELAEKARKASHLVTILVTMASLMLIFAFLTDSFNIEYVYSYSSRSLSWPYKLSGIWAGLDGSLLFWAWILVIYASIVAFRKRDENFPYINAVLQVVVAFFLVMLVFDANPFAELSSTPHDGRGLNPLLQNFFMIFHPPALYLGYVGFTVPFAYAIATLLMKRREDSEYNWVKEVRFWTILSWLFLTVGNLLGAMWAYVELGWGGFWAWDPVENAGILPWFTATAFLHSIIMQEKRGMLKVWNLSLVVLTFLLTIFGTFITRSGVIQSVHSFSNVTIGIYFLAFLTVATIFSFYLILRRGKELRGHREIESFFSRETSFYINNVLFIFALVAVFWGTMLPLFSELITGQQMEVGPPFFNRVMAPIGIALLFLTGIGPEMSWRRARKHLFKHEFLVPLIIAAIAAIVTFAFGIRKWFVIATAAGVAFVFVTIINEFWRSSRIEAKRLSVNPFKALASLFRLAPRRYGGYLVHFGVILLFVGIAGSAYQSEYSVSLTKGQKEKVGGYELSLGELEWVRGPDVEAVFANVTLEAEGKEKFTLKPALFLHKNQPKPIAEVDLTTGLLGDVYLALGGINREETGADFKLIVNPLIIWVWLGGFIMILGTIVALLPARRRPGASNDFSEEVELDVLLGRAQREDFNV